MSSAPQVVSSLGRRIEQTLAPFLPRGGYAMVDFPDYANVGDSAIWLGQLAHFRRALGRDPAYVASIGSFDPRELRKALPEGPIFINGGGNFGDIWPAHQLFRVKLLELFPDRQVVQLPQAIHFDDPAVAAETAQAIRRHGNVVLMVRDQPSFDYATAHFECQVVLCPDMALCLGSLPRMQPPDTGALYLLRTDKERAGPSASAPPQDGVVVDWVREPKRAVRRAGLMGQLSGLARGRFGRQARLGLDYEARALHRLHRGRALLSRGQVVVTDRLHAHILCVLMDIPHAILDNSYGKVTGFWSRWTSEVAGVRRAGSLGEAEAWARAAQPG